MGKIAFLWELGAGYGHLSRLLPLALGLRARGHEPVFILRALQHAETLLGPEHIAYTQAPVWMESIKQRRPPLNYSETLFLFGFINPHALHTLARAWRYQLEALKPDLLVLDQAPVAQLATRGLGIPRLLTGNSFAIPPRTTPLTPYRWWEPAPPADVLHESEARLTRHANAALARLGGPALGCVADLFEAEASLMTGFSALDVYGARGPEAFAGISRQSHRHPAPDWPDVAGKRVFVYLPASHPVLPSLLDALAGLEANILAFILGLAPEAVNAAQRRHLRILDHPVDLTRVAAECAVAVCHGGSGVSETLLAAGKPLLLLPYQMEQGMSSQRITRLGCGLMHTLDDPPARLRERLSALLHETRYAEAARAFAESVRETLTESATDRLLRRCETLLRAREAGALKSTKGRPELT